MTTIPQDMTDPTTEPTTALTGPSDPLPLDLHEDFQPPRLSLRALAFEALLIDATLELTEGELTPELEARLDQLGVALMHKADGIADYIDALNADVAVFKAEEQRLAEQRKAREKRIEKFKDYVMSLMQRMGRPKLEGTFRKLAVTKTPGTVEVVNLSALPSSMTRTEVVVSPQKTVIKDAIKKAGGDTLYLEHVVGLSASFTLEHNEATGVSRIVEVSPLLEDEPREVARFLTSDLLGVEERKLDGDAIEQVVRYREPLARVVPGVTLRIT